MDVQTNVGISSSGFSAPWDFLSETNKENDDSSLEWLSIYVEDCLSSGTNYYTQTQIKPDPKSETLPLNPNPNSDPNPINQLSKPNPISDPDQITQQSKSCEIIKKTKKRSISLFEEPPLLHNQTQWLADSEPIYPLTQLKPVPPNPPKKKKKTKQKNVIEKSGLIKDEKMQRRCTHCLSNKTPQWREGPMGPKTLCNACGVRFKSGRLLPEYRPAKSPTFQSFKHSNSHRKVLEMRMMATMIENNDH